MKKFLTLLFCTVFLLSMAGCSVSSSVSTNNSSTDSETVNGITRTITTNTVDGKTETTITYTDADGDELDAAIGEAAFKAAQDGDENPLETAMAEVENGDTDSDADQIYTAAMKFVNDTDVDISELYFVLQDADWGDNLMSDGTIIPAGSEASLDGSLTYSPNMEFMVSFSDGSAVDIEFQNFTIGTIDDPENVTIIFSGNSDEGTYYIEAE